MLIIFKNCFMSNGLHLSFCITTTNDSNDNEVAMGCIIFCASTTNEGNDNDLAMGRISFCATTSNNSSDN